MDHSQSFLQKRKMLVFLPIVGVPFLAIFFNLFGGGSNVMAESTTGGPPSSGINTLVPHASNDNTIYSSKLKAYEQIAQDSATRKKNTSFSLLDGDLGGLLSSDTTKNLNNSLPASTSSNEPGAYNYDLNRSREQQANAPEQIALTQAHQELEKANQLASGNPPTRGYGYSSGNGSYGKPSGGYEVENATERKLLEDIEAQRKQRDELVGILKKKLEQTESQGNQMGSPNDIYNAPIKEAQPETKPASSKNRKITVKVIEKDNVQESRLNPTTQKAFVEQDVDEPRHGLNNGFYSPDKGSKTSDDANVIMAVVHDEQTLYSGSTVKMRLKNTIKVGTVSIPKGTFIYGLCSLSDERLKVKIESIRYQEMLFPVELSVYDLDGIEGLFMPGSLSRTVVKQGASQGLGSANFIGTSPSITSQLTQTAIEAGKSIASKKTALVRVTLKSNYEILLKPSEE